MLYIIYLYARRNIYQSVCNRYENMVYGGLDPVCVPLHDGRDVRLMGRVCTDTVNCRGGIHGRSAFSVGAASTEPPAASIARARTLGPRCEWRRDKEVFSV